MVKKWNVFITLIFLVSLSGCASLSKQRNLEAQGLRNQISLLEAQLKTKDAEIESLKEALLKAEEEKRIADTLEAKQKAKEEPYVPVVSARKKRAIGEVKSRLTIRKAQIALKNAGYNPGAIDGKMGRQTKEALKAFQKNNNLSADGKLDAQTRDLLRQYLYKKVK